MFLICHPHLSCAKVGPGPGLERVCVLPVWSGCLKLLDGLRLCGLLFSRVFLVSEKLEELMWDGLCVSVLSFWRLLLSNGPPFFVFQDGISRYSSSKIDFPTWVFLQQKIQCLAPVSSCWLNTDHSVVSFLISPSSIFTEVPRVHCQTLEEALSDCCCCGCECCRGCECCCCECHLLPGVTCSIPVLRNYLVDAICWHRIAYDYCM